MMTEPDSKYIHGGVPKADMQRLDVAERRVLDFSVNLNFFGPPPIIKEKWSELFETIEQYPSVEGDGVAQYYQSVCGVPHRNFLAGNGSTELIYLAARVLGYKRAAIITPSFHDYERASLLAGAEVLRCPLFPHNDFAFPPKEQLMEMIKNVDALWIARPNNPTGNLFSKTLVLELADQFPEKWFIVDEAFVQFLDDWKERSLLTENPKNNVLVLNSLTKFYAVAGLRLGGMVGHESVISRMKHAKEPWAINGIADRVASLLSGCTDYDEKSRLAMNAEKERVFEALKDMDGILPFPPSANYILCQWRKTDNLDHLLAHLLTNGVYIRDCRNFPGLEKNYFRLGFRIPEENDRMLSLMASFEAPRSDPLQRAISSPPYTSEGVFLLNER
ncbi:MAG: pyridoxal phosphate-dependent class II aminotransferase [Deltaproteobacteria bacterium]|nr:pyridoxal phosphate-dependent class II aminotransferase [Deltaproteobacteria bacterium]